MILAALSLGGFAVYEVGQSNANPSSSSSTSSNSSTNAGQTPYTKFYDPLIDLIPKGTDIANLTNPVNVSSSDLFPYQSNSKFVPNNSSSFVNQGQNNSSNINSNIQTQSSALTTLMQNNIPIGTPSIGTVFNPTSNNPTIVGQTPSGQVLKFPLSYAGSTSVVTTNGVSNQLANVIVNQGGFTGSGLYVNPGQSVNSAMYIGSQAQYNKQASLGNIEIKGASSAPVSQVTNSNSIIFNGQSVSPGQTIIFGGNINNANLSGNKGGYVAPSMPTMVKSVTGGTSIPSFVQNTFSEVTSAVKSSAFSGYTPPITSPGVSSGGNSTATSSVGIFANINNATNYARGGTNTPNYVQNSNESLGYG